MSESSKKNCRNAGFSSKRIASIDFLSPELMYKLRNQVLHVGGYSATADFEKNKDKFNDSLMPILDYREEFKLI